MDPAYHVDAYPYPTFQFDEDSSESGSTTLLTTVLFLLCGAVKRILDINYYPLGWFLSLGYKQGITWVEGDAQQLPFEDNSFDAYTIAFGIRCRLFYY